jgi:hypothetical protein
LPRRRVVQHHLRHMLPMSSGVAWGVLRVASWISWGNEVVRVPRIIPWEMRSSRTLRSGDQMPVLTSDYASHCSFFGICLSQNGSRRSAATPLPQRNVVCGCGRRRSMAWLGLRRNTRYFLSNLFFDECLTSVGEIHVAQFKKAKRV